jgi:diguanylate cyclase
LQDRARSADYQSMSNDLVSLGLNVASEAPDAGPATEAGGLRHILDDALASVADAIEAGDPIPADVTSALNACRAAVAGGVDAAALVPLADACFNSIRRFTAHARGCAVGQRAQITDLVAMVQEAVATIAGSHTSIDKTLTGSAERFERLSQLDNIGEIQARLVDEVATLKRIAIERRASWDQTFADFGQRLSGLETQLDSTRREASIDPLTSIANRRTFESACEAWMGPNRPAFVMAMADVDDFKAINDRHGHAVCDQVLVTVAKTLSRSFRSDDLVARLGGDEFAILAATLTLPQALGRFQAIVLAVGTACRPLIPEGTTPTLSIGLAVNSTGDTPESLLKRADEALYEAKRNGKGRVVGKARPFTRDLLKGWRTPAGDAIKPAATGTPSRSR